MSEQSQSQKVKEVVDELSRLRHDYEDKQAELRSKLHDLFGCGPDMPQREIVKKLVDMFLFPES